MAGQTQQSSIFGQLTESLGKSTSAHMNDAPDRGNEDLPPGISNGVARLRKCEFGVYGPDTKTPGKPYFYADAVVVHPIEITDKDGVKHKVAGRYTKIRESLFDEPSKKDGRNTLDQHWGWMMNELRILNGDTLPDLKIGVTPGMSVQQENAIIETNVKAFMANLTRARPYTKFRTYIIPKDKPTERDGKWYLGARRGPYASFDKLKEANPYMDRDPMTLHEWQGSTAWDVPSPNGAAAPAMGIGQPAAPTATSTPVPQAAPTPEPAPVPFDDGAEESLDDLVARCAADTSARPLLLDRLIAVGGTKDEFHNAKSWEEIGDMIRERQVANAATDESGEGEGESEGEGEGEGEGEPEKPWAPEKGQTYPFHPLGADKKPLKKRVNGTVLTVNNSKQTVGLKGDDGKKYGEVAWDRLIRE